MAWQLVACHIRLCYVSKPGHLPSVAVTQASKAFCDNKEDLLQLWVHETFRVMGDRMWDPADVEWLRKQIDERLSSAFSTNFATLFEDFNNAVSHSIEDNISRALHLTLSRWSDP
jgi:hypothetical protein